MLNEPSSATTPTSQGREERRQQLLEAMRGEADRVLERLADELVDLPDDKAFGAIEYTLRDLSHDFAARAHQAGLEAGKKRATKARASSARTARPTPGSSATDERPG
jgi:hypothetical protein